MHLLVFGSGLKPGWHVGAGAVGRSGVDRVGVAQAVVISGGLLLVHLAVQLKPPYTLRHTSVSRLHVSKPRAHSSKSKKIIEVS